MKRSIVMRGCICGLMVWMFIAAPVLSQDDDEESPYRPGLAMRYYQDRTSIERIEPTLALAWHTAPDDSRLKPGALRATWQGRLLTQGGGEYRLHVYGQGSVKILLAGKTVLEGELAKLGWLSSEVLTIEHDYHPLDVRYESTAEAPQLRLFWSGEQFSLEPVPAKQLFHEPPQKATASFEHGRELAQAMRCDKCHLAGREAASPPAVALDRIGKLYQGNELARWLHRKHGQRADESPQVASTEIAPHFDALDEQATADIAAYLTSKAQKTSPRLGKQAPGDAARGTRLYHTLGCLACHQNQGIGTTGPWSGGDLSHIGVKRDRDFFFRWLAEPQAINADHRMPVFELTQAETADLAEYLTTLRPSRMDEHKALAGDAERGQSLVGDLNCAACHRLPQRERANPRLAWEPQQPSPSAICRSSDAVAKQVPHYTLSDSDAADLHAFLSAFGESGLKTEPSPATAPQILAQRNCLACHTRETSVGLAPQLVKLAEKDAQYHSLLPALTPPSLVSVGDKLEDTVLLAMMKKMEEPHRDYLRVRMPRFEFTQDELETLLAHFVTTDRIPPHPPDERLTPPKTLKTVQDLEKAGETLVTTNGFGCTSCHAIGGKPPVKATLNARGPNLSRIGFRTREPWFYRWCQNPARIIPGQEMPAVQVPVKGVLGDDVRQQLAAVWTILNKPGFEPKDAGPLRIVRRTGDPGAKERAIVGTDVIKTDGKTCIAPVVIALPNRHNVLFDLETGRLARWWLGDTMEQRTLGKTWYWQTDAPDILQAGFESPELTMVRPGQDPVPQRAGQFTTEIDELQFDGQRLTLLHRLHFQDIAPTPGQRTVFVRQSFAPTATAWSQSLERLVGVTGLPKDSVARLRVLSSERMKGAKIGERGRTIVLPELSLKLADDSEGHFEGDGTLVTSASAGVESECWLRIEYHSTTAADRFELAPAPGRKVLRGELSVVPGLKAMRLPLDATIMPTGLAWQQDGNGMTRLAIASLEGRVWLANDTDEGGFQDQSHPLSMELAAPYGVAAVPGRSLGAHVDVMAKDGLWRLFHNERGEVERVRRLASGWGHTDDYHDWAVGLVVADPHRYFAAIPAQQDNRSSAAARYRGQAIEITFDDALRNEQPWHAPKFTLEPLSSGHRFPMGIARNKAGELFVTDNQGNYNPFNELNHVQPGKDFGFVNALDKGKPKPPLTPPAINIPHPWTRSVNGICFLETPKDVREKLGRAAWGPFEDHLVGCEYDTRRLIRFSLQKVGDTFQGACYPFSLEKPASEGLLGPICCAIAPSGDLYVGNIRDSGWGGGNNTGEVVRVGHPAKLADLPIGIAEVRATSEGFEIDFTQSVDKSRAADAKNYTVESFTRKSTPAYGGPDEQRRVEKVVSIVVAEDGRRATIKLAELRPGFVYELQLKNLTESGQDPFFPALAYYTLNHIPTKL